MSIDPKPADEGDAICIQHIQMGENWIIGLNPHGFG